RNRKSRPIQRFRSSMNPRSAERARPQRRFNTETAKTAEALGSACFASSALNPFSAVSAPSADANVGPAYRIQPRMRDPVMRYIQFSLPNDRTERLGVLRDDRVVDAGQIASQWSGSTPQTLLELIQAGPEGGGPLS